MTKEELKEVLQIIDIEMDLINYYLNVCNNILEKPEYPEIKSDNIKSTVFKSYSKN